MKKIVFTGGGTAGHIYPNLAIAESLENYEKHYIGTAGMEKEILAKIKDFTFHEITAVKLDRTKHLKNLLIPVKLLKSILEAKKTLKKIRPDIIFSKGGFVALPVAIAGWQMRIPIITHESDLTLGLANKLIAKLSKVCCTTFYETSKKSNKFIWTGQPIRKELDNGNREKVLAKLNFPSQKILLFVGGSLGSKKINNLLKAPEYLTSKYAVIIGTGKNNIKDFTPQKNFLPMAYLNPIADYYSSADLVITRAGSGAINELLYLNKPMLLLPLSKTASRGDQIENAKLFTKLGYSEMILDEDLTKENLQEMIEKMIKNLNFYKNNMKKTLKQDANKKIIDLIKKFS